MFIHACAHGGFIKYRWRGIYYILPQWLQPLGALSTFSKAALTMGLYMTQHIYYKQACHRSKAFGSTHGFEHNTGIPACFTSCQFTAKVLLGVF